MLKKTFAVVSILMTLLLVAYPPFASAGEATRVDGQAAKVEFSLFLPEQWNGSLALLVHGSLPGLFEALAPDLLASGFGVAFTRLPVEVGEAEALKLATLHTRIAKAQFVSYFGRPDDVYLLAVSRGAHSAAKLLETSPAQYSGMLSVCGGNGGAQRQWDYFFTARILFDYFFPGVLPGDARSMPALDIRSFVNNVAPDVVAAIVANPSAAMEMAAVDQYDLHYNDFGELVNGIVQSLVIHSIGVNDLLATANGNPFDNFFLSYSGSGDDQALNAGVTRLAADPAARRYLKVWYEPDGAIDGTPVLLLHTSRDPIVPEAANNDKYESLVRSTGNENYIFRRVLDGFGHCTPGIANADIISSFSALVAWAESGVPPS
jgi:pimeloyl-ACP methyl ester carboxylesterase